MSNLEINLKLQPVERQLFKTYESSSATTIGLGGARGGTKSHCGRTLMIYRRFKFPKTSAVIIRKTLDDLRDNHIRMITLLEFPFMREWYNKQEKLLTFPNGSFIRFISSDDYDDIFQHYGKEFADVYIDQAEQFGQEQLEFIKTLNRCTTNDDIIPKTLLTFNPGGMGHTYLKRIFIQRDFEGNEDPGDYEFIRAYGWDNAIWSRKSLNADGLSFQDYYGWDSEKRKSYFVSRSDYGAKLNTLPDSQRRAQLDGDFDVFEGQFFEMWRDSLHVIPAFDLHDPAFRKVFDEWEKLGTIDYGERTALEIQCRDHEGRIVNFAESYTTSLIPSDRFNLMADLLIELNLFKLSIQYDTNMEYSLKHYSGAEHSPAEIAMEVFRQRMGDNAPILYVVSKASTDKRGYRVVCNEAVIEMLAWKRDERGILTQSPKLFVTENCKHLRRTIVTLQRDKDSFDGLDFHDTIGEDDPYDALKMCVVALQTPRQKPKPKYYESAEEYMREKVFHPIMTKSLRRGKRADML